MKCERCNEKDATIHISKIEAGLKTTLNLCEQCAMQEGILYSFKPKVIEFSKASKKCPNCGLTEEGFITKGLLGCSKCYEAFPDRIEQLLSNLQGTVCHKGRTPKTSEKVVDGTTSDIEKEQKRVGESISELEAVCYQMEEAIKCERYEDAAVLRDRIKAIKEETAPGEREES